MKQRLVLRFLLLIALVGCTVGPDYEPPPPEVPDVWKASVEEELTAPSSPLETWWLNLHDPELLDLIQRAVESNLNLQTAAARVYEARAFLGIATGRYYPDVILDGTYNRSEPSENVPLGGITPPEGFEAGDLYNVGVGFQWEIDVFGRLRRGAEAARANLEASIEDYRDVLVILLADTAANYVDVRTFQARIRYAPRQRRGPTREPAPHPRPIQRGSHVFERRHPGGVESR